MISLFRRVLEQVIEQTNFEIQIAAKPLDASGEAASYIYITQTDFEHHFSQLFLVGGVLPRWTFHEKYFFCWGTKTMLYI